MLKLKLILFDFHNIDGLLVNATLVSIPKHRKITEFLPFVNDLKTLNRIFSHTGRKVRIKKPLILLTGGFI